MPFPPFGPQKPPYGAYDMPGERRRMPKRTVYHLTTQNNAKNILRYGFDFNRIGSGAGLGLFEEPAGIFVSEMGDEGYFEKECQERELGFDRKLTVELDAGIMWIPERDERLDVFKRFYAAYLMQKYRLNPLQVEALRRYSPHWMDKLGIPKNVQLARDDEIEVKQAFRRYLIGLGVRFMHWREPVRGVSQTLVLDEFAIKRIWVSPPIVENPQQYDYNQDFADKVIASYGTTEDIDIACYLLPDGNMLNCKCPGHVRRWTDPECPRASHETVAMQALSQFMPNTTISKSVFKRDPVLAFCALTGFIRIGLFDDCYIVDIYRIPTREQLSRIRKIVRWLQDVHPRAEIVCEFKFNDRMPYAHAHYSPFDEDVMMADIRKYGGLL